MIHWFTSFWLVRDSLDEFPRGFPKNLHSTEVEKVSEPGNLVPRKFLGGDISRKFNHNSSIVFVLYNCYNVSFNSRDATVIQTNISNFRDGRNNLYRCVLYNNFNKYNNGHKLEKSCILYTLFKVQFTLLYLFIFNFRDCMRFIICYNLSIYQVELINFANIWRYFLVLANKEAPLKLVWSGILK